MTDTVIRTGQPTEDAEADERRAAIVRRVLGEDTLRELRDLMRPVAMGVPVESAPFDLSELAAPRVWQAIRTPLYRLDTGLTEAEATITPAWDLHRISSLRPPYEFGPNRTDHGGHEPERHSVVAFAGGAMRIHTVIERRSSNTFGSAVVMGRITPAFSGGSLSFRPTVAYRATHYVEAAGLGESHSAGFIHAALFSMLPDGSDMRPELSATGIQLWDTRAAGAFGVRRGRQLDSVVPDTEGVAEGPALTVDIGNVDRNRVYLGQVRIESRCDADGKDSTWSPSQASVGFDALLKDAVVEQWA